MNKTDSECDFEPITLEFKKKKKKELKQKILESLNFWSCECVPLLIYCIFAQKNFPGSNC